MNRKEFIKNISLVGLGVSLTPTRLFASNSPTKSYRLPKPTVHIPHGNFDALEIEKLTIPELNIECTVQQFMRNGISECDDDLTVFTFVSGNEQQSICITRDGNRFTDGNISHLTVSVNSFDSAYFSIEKK